MKKCTLLLTLISILTMASCSDKNRSENPFFAEWDTAYGMPPFDKIKPEHYKSAYEEAIKQHNAEIEAIINNTETPDFENVILALDNAGEMLGRIGTIFSMVNSADSNEALRAIEKEMSPILTAHSDNINLNPKLFGKIKEVYDNISAMNLNPIQARLLEKKYESFVRSGALLADAQKEQLREINNKLAETGVKFRSNLLAEGQKFVMILDMNDTKGLPLGVRNAASEFATKLEHEGKFAFNLDNVSRIPFLTYAENRELREQIYNGYIERCNHGDELDNNDVINDMIRLRLERAQLLGYESFADFALEQRMAKTSENVYTLLDKLWEPALEGASKDMEEMREIKIKETGDPDFQGWDWWYYAEKLRKQKYDLNEELLKPYFSLSQVQYGIFELCNNLYGITFQPVKVPVYNTECVTFEVRDADNSHLGILLMDFHPRDGKRVGAWCGSYRGREYVDGVKTEDPIVYIVCNFTRKVGNVPALLTLDETTTFFHEFGHALHTLFGETPYKGLRRTEQDFVELPSQIMENWAFEPEMLRKYAVHYDENKSDRMIPDYLIERIQNSSLFNQGFILTEHLASTFSDMDVHCLTSYEPLDLNEYERDILNVRRGMIPQIAPRYSFPYFNHIFGGNYSAGYYSYKWAEVLDKDAYEAFIETGDIFNRNVAAKFREEILSKGGTSDGMVLYTNFRGKEPSLDYLLYASGLKERPQEIVEPPVDIDMLEQVEPDSQE